MKTTIDPAKRLELYIRKARNGSKTFVFTNSSGADYDISSFDFELFIKKNAGARKDVISLLTSYAGFGLTISGNELLATFTDIITDIDAGEYYWELLRLDTNKTWLCGPCYVHEGEFDGVGTDTSTISIADTTTVTVSITDSGAAIWGAITGTLSNQSDLNTALSGKQATLVSGTNIKTVNSNSLLGSGDVSIAGGSNFYLFDGNFTTLQTYIDGISSGSDVNIFFPSGSYNLSTAITFTSKGVVRLWGEDATIVNTRASGGDLFDINNCNGFSIRNLNINMNKASNTQSVDAFDIDNTSASSDFPSLIEGVNVYNFYSENVVGFRLNYIPNSSFEIPGLLISKCNFWNSFSFGTFDYNSNTAKGIGILMNEMVEYTKVIDCSFVNINVGLWMKNGANSIVSNCSFLHTLGRFSSTNYGAIYMDGGSSLNDGKITISNCKFNHNWSYCINNSQTTTGRSSIITGNQFIANAIRPIIFLGTTYHIISNNSFNTSNTSQTGATNSPFTVSACNYMTLSNTLRAYINNNSFMTFTSGEPIITTTGTADYNVIKNNVYPTGATFTSLAGANDIVSGNEAV